MQFGCFNLQSAIDENYDTLLGAEQLAWEASINLPTKLAVVFCFPGYPLYNRQVTVLTAHRVPPTRGKMARIIAQEMRKFLARTEYQRPVCWYGREVSLADLFLGYMQHVSRGSLQAQIGIRFCQLASWVPECVSFPPSIHAQQADLHLRSGPRTPNTSRHIAVD
ncbi:hypothetical protein BD310DRAFT_822851 [Dichomitus squalens]|uniref:Uncharacterized protein n=1 Tax=Dichomitus squalens TaxID=114155 RepID=A0A4Q9PR35_9APHY|nr:hypothetical protein BD310DRAFT_822851 [Dichomitus squalens]